MAEDTPDPDANRSRLSQLSATRTIEAGNPGYTRLVRLLKLLLPLAALSIVAVVMAWPNMNQVKTAAQKPAPSQQEGSNQLIHPRFAGEDDKHEPYTVVAKTAVQSAGDPDIVLLDHPVGHMTLAGGTILDGDSIKGTYHQKAQLLLLEGDVHLRNSQGYHGTTDRLLVDMHGHKTSTDTPVAGDGPGASIQATGLRGDQETGILVFTGPARLVLKNVKAMQ
jgi:lipopolysaccharide export system protein LptC